MSTSSSSLSSSSSSSSLISLHVPNKQVHQSSHLLNDRLSNRRDWGAGFGKSTRYKICVSGFCALLVLVLCFKGAESIFFLVRSSVAFTLAPFPKIGFFFVAHAHDTAIPRYAPNELTAATGGSRVDGINISQSALEHVVDVPEVRKALVVVARSRDEARWMEQVPEDWVQYLYLIDEDTNPNHTLSVPANKGNEAMRYLSFIIDNYDSLPDIMAFRHGHENAWHQSFDSAAEVNNLNLTTVRSRGYQNFNCEARSGCDEGILLADMQRAENASIGVTSRSLSRRSDPPVNAAIYEYWDEWFGVPMPEELTSACCAQFIVAKEAVWHQSKQKYIEFRQWLMTSDLPDRHSGMVFEKIWHVIFGMPPAHCEAVDQCYCNVYTGPLTRDCPS